MCSPSAPTLTDINAKFCQTRAADAEDAAFEAWAARKLENHGQAK
jgi:hypothetical protein